MNKSSTKLLLIAFVGSIFIITFLFFKAMSLETEGITKLQQLPNSINLWVIFFTGLTVGGLTCLAVQGGLLASVIAAREKDEIERGINHRDAVFPTLAFLSAKILSYMLFGFILGTFGGTIGISQTAQIIMQFAAGLYMIVVALNLLNVHPIFGYVIIQPPKFLTRKVRNQSKSNNLFAPAILGAMTIFIPCGTTLAMEALAISSANGFMGSLIMAIFILGTMPLFFGVGFTTSILGDSFRSKFLKVAALAVLYLGATTLNGALVASGSPITFQSLAESSFNLRGNRNQLSSPTNVKVINGVQNVDIAVTSGGYTPNLITVKKGQPVKLNLKAIGAYSCATAFRIPSLGVVKNLQPNETDSIEFTPQSVGKITFTCSMGMYGGVIEVI